MITIIYEKGIAFVIGKDKNGVIIYKQSPFVGGKYINVKNKRKKVVDNYFNV